MSLVGFKARNHPQQKPKPYVDEMATPPELFEPLNERFRFTVDVAALPHNAKCDRFLTPQEDGLVQSWAGERVWCNPPYSNIRAWVLKAWAEHPHAERIVMLLPANRTEQPWWQDYVEPARRANRLTVEFLAGRQRFIRHDRDKVYPNERPPFGVCLVIW